MTMTAMKIHLIRLPEVQRRTGYSKAWIYKLISDGAFPQQVKIGPRSVAFIEAEIDDWIAQRIAESRAA
ncbi:helix-turn-helix transcriptional regulator [Xenorhabdus hominickii]|uniref:Dipicolinate synthase n=1 Tax=Xenorhabdus hominickii TaxID=351679 RepID=A0A2G0QDH3_XENHO|nr:AlpA family transcriptional regulator [Xenorhabdus hominickii]AOM41364.1 dipicolinate synthase [Xenorhabdus hominickii]PHM55365.1 dipicolinate synthase [Xenorhabdus hominickii]PHM57270.1 dipicolinate synthase [Xenorhabdus hominickii]